MSFAMRLTHRLHTLSWRLFRPTTVGVRALILDERIGEQLGLRSIDSAW